MITKRLLPQTPARTGWPWDIPHDLYSSPVMPNGEPWPSVTVVMPSFNQGMFLEEAIRSVLLQNYPALHLFIFDAGSTDESLAIIQKYAPFIDFWRSAPDNGQSAAINEGIERSQSEFVAWLNSDDVYLPGCIEHLVGLFLRNPQAGMVYAQVEVINENGARVGKFEPAVPDIANLLSFQAILPQQAALFRTAAVRKAGLLRTDLHYAMDHDLFIRIAHQYPIIGSDEIMALFRMSTINKGVLHRTRWAAEFIRICEDFYTRADLSTETLAFKPQALAGAYFRGGAAFLEAYETRTALRWFLTAARISPAILRKPGWWKKTLRASLGPIPNQVLQWARNRLQNAGFYQNPYDWQTGLETRPAAHNSKGKR